MFTAVIIIKPMNAMTLPDVSQWEGACELADLAVLSTRGADAATFLHGQLSQDVQSLTADQARLGAYCSAKGRMLASGLLLRPAPDEVLWVLSADVLETTLKRLRMFVLRAKAQLADERGRIRVTGLLGPNSLASVPGVDAKALAAPGATQVLADGAGQVVRLPDAGGVPRALWLAPVDMAMAVTWPALPLADWQWLELQAGIPRVQAATADQFVPQMVNFELVGGVNFKKGCYPGQEIVARSQYRGTTKRRLFLARASGPVQAGQEVFAATDPDQPAGLVANAATASQAAGGTLALIELKLAMRDTPLRVGGADGVPLTLLALPYDVPMADD